MNKKLYIFLLIIIFVFGYTVYESIKLDHKLGNTNIGKTGTIIKELPREIKWKKFAEGKKVAFNIEELLSDNKKVIVHFWATWCAPCEVEFPDLIELTQLMKNKSDLVFLLVAVNDDLQKVKKFIDKFDLTKNTTIILDDDDQYKRFGSYKLPETFIFGPKGKVIRKFSGQQAWTQSFFVNYMNSL